METRKVQEVGGGTYTVSLPKEWTESADVSAGSVVNLHRHIDDLLVVEPREGEEGTPRRVTVRVEHEDEARIERTVRAAYAAGYEEIVLDAPDGLTRDQRRTVGDVSGTLVGATVDTQSERRLTVRTLVDPHEVSPRQSVRQLAFVVLSMHREATAAVAGDRPADRRAVRDDEADRLYAMIDRQFGRGLARLDAVDALGVTRPELFEVRSVGRELERVGDHAERIASVAPDVALASDSPAAAEVRSVSAATREVLEDAVRVVLDETDRRAAQRVLDDRDAVREELAGIDRRLFDDGDRSYRLARALDSLRRTVDHAGNVAELGLRSALQDARRSGSSEDSGRPVSDRKPTDGTPDDGE